MRDQRQGVEVYGQRLRRLGFFGLLHVSQVIDADTVQVQSAADNVGPANDKP